MTHFGAYDSAFRSTFLHPNLKMIEIDCEREIEGYIQIKKKRDK